MPDPFHDDMLAALPRLHRLALALTHSRTEAEDLVQEVAVAALGAGRVPGRGVEALARNDPGQAGLPFVSWPRRAG